MAQITLPAPVNGIVTIPANPSGAYLAEWLQLTTTANGKTTTRNQLTSIPRWVTATVSSPHNCISYTTWAELIAELTALGIATATLKDPKATSK